MVACSASHARARFARGPWRNALPSRSTTVCPRFTARTRTRTPPAPAPLKPRSVDVCNPTFKDRAAEHCAAHAAAALTRRNRGGATLFHGVPQSSCCAFRGRCEPLGLRCVNTDCFTAREDCDRRPCERPPHYNERQCPTRHPRDTRSLLSRASHHPRSREAW
jgi:hypothetical protein